MDKSDISNFETVMPIPLAFGQEEKEDEEDDDEERDKSKLSRKSKSGVDRLTTTSRGNDEEDEGEDFMLRADEFGRKNFF